MPKISSHHSILLSRMRCGQDKLEQKKFFQRHKVPTGSFIGLELGEDIREAAEVFGFPFMLKSCRCWALIPHKLAPLYNTIVCSTVLGTFAPQPESLLPRLGSRP